MIRMIIHSYPCVVNIHGTCGDPVVGCVRRMYPAILTLKHGFSVSFAVSFLGFFRGFAVSFAVSFLGPSAMECVGLAPEAPTAAPQVCPVKPVPVWRHWGIGLGKEVLPPRSTVVPPAST